MKNNRIAVFIIALAMMVTTVFATTTAPQAAKPVQVHFIDTGNSDSILILDNGKSMLIDAADNDDEKLLTEYLITQKVNKLDYVVLTHPDADHVGALDSVIKNFEIGTILIGNGSADTKTYKDFVQAAVNKNLKPSIPLEDILFTLGNGTFQFYNTKSQTKDVNDRSLVMLYKNGSHEFLFTGDAGKSVEKSILKKMIDVDVLKVGHHGSNTSTSKELLDKIKPEIAVLTVGKDNKYGHPHKEVNDRLANIKTYRTDTNGNIIIDTDGKTLSVSTQKTDGKSTQKPTITKFDTVSNTIIINPTNPEESINTVQKVWVTGTGKKYHYQTCRYVNTTSKELTIDDAKKHGYESCKVCHTY